MQPIFTERNRVAEAIAVDPGLVERLSGYHPAFAKLKNPVLRRVMARLVTFGEAAKVAGVPVEELMAVVNRTAPDGHRAGHRADAGGAAPAVAEAVPDWVGQEDGDVRHFDARPLLASGLEPLGAIMSQAAAVPQGKILVVDAPFDPAPLRRVLAGKGFSHYGQTLAPDHWRIWFRRDGGGAGATATPAAVCGVRIWPSGPAVHIDVRGLEAPKPMVAIIALIEAESTGNLVVVHHEREPVYLFPELAERGWEWEVGSGAEGEVLVTLRRGSC